MGWRKCGSGGCFSGICCISFTCARVVQGERRAELARALLSRSPHSQKHLHCFCKVTKKSWNFQIVSTKNCTFGYENCTLGSFWCFLGECRSTKVFQAICNPMQTAILTPFLSQMTDDSLFMSPSSGAELEKMSKNVSKNIYYYI